MSTRPIGVYDSGVGGLTVLKMLQRLLPHENFVYFADTAHLPYGDKTPQQIVDYGRLVLTWMQGVANVKMVVAACHTSSAIALPTLISEFSVPIIGTIEPLVETIMRIEGAKIGIIATPATAASKVHEDIFRQRGFKGLLMTIGCPDFVPLIEAGLEEGQMNDGLLREIAEQYLARFHIYQLNTLIYGCTHYPLIQSIIEIMSPRPMHFIDPAEAIAKQVIQDLERLSLSNTSGLQPTVKFECNGDKAVFQRKVDMVYV